MIDDDTLLLYYYGDELNEVEQRRVADALAQDAPLASRYAQLVASLQPFAVATSDTISAALKLRLHDLVDDAAADAAADAEAAVAGSTRHWMRLAPAVAVAATVVVAIMVVRPGEQAGGSANETPVAASSPPPEVRFERGLTAHFAAAREALDALPAGSDEDRVALARDLALRNRSLVFAASRLDADHHARVLRAHDLLLLELASPELSKARAAALREQLAFEAAVMLTKLAGTASNAV